MFMLFENFTKSQLQFCNYRLFGKKGPPHTLQDNCTLFSRIFCALKGTAPNPDSKICFVQFPSQSRVVPSSIRETPIFVKVTRHYHKDCTFRMLHRNCLNTYCMDLAEQFHFNLVCLLYLSLSFLKTGISDCILCLRYLKTSGKFNYNFAVIEYFGEKGPPHPLHNN